jgi:hypothetical protein
MTQTLQQALLKAGLVTQEKLKKAESEKKAARRSHNQAQHQSRPAHQARPARPPQQQVQPEKRQKPMPERPPAPPAVKKSVGFIEGKHHHHIRTDCEACGKSFPDVEYYEHKNRSLDKYWLCVRCADNNNILDDYRQTMQSSQSQKGLFQRGYGHTKIFRRKL